MTAGRIKLTADATYHCTPFGGIGLTDGLVDVGELAECLERIERELAGDEKLEKYCEITRQK